MRIKSLALATTLSLLSTSALVGAVHAQKGVTLQPKSSWAVKRVNEGGSDAYCALARRFEQELILTLAKNDKHEISFAIDFPQGNFSAHQRYDISLDPGAGEQRKFKVKPAGSGKAFVVRVGSDQKFMSALLRTGYLRVVVENENYNFNLADIDQGQEQLEACLYAGMTPAAGNSSAVSVPSTAQLTNLRAEKDKLEQRLQTLEQENETLRIRAASLASGQGQVNEENTSSALKVTSSPAVDGLMKQIASLKNENAELKKLTGASNNDTAVSTDVSVIELARENQRLQDLLQEQDGVENYKRQVEQLTRRITSLENENLTLAQQKSSALPDELKQDLERQILALKSENGALRQNIEQKSGANNDDFETIKKELSDLEQENARLNARVSALVNDKATVMEQLGYYEEENATLRDARSSGNTELLSQLREEIRKIESNNARLLGQKENEISALQSDLQALKAEQTRALASKDDIRSQAEKEFATQIEALSIKNEALREELVSLSKDQTVLDNYKNKIDLVTQEKLDLQAKLESAHTKIADLQSTIEMQREKTEDNVALGLQIEGLNAEIASLRASVSELTTKNETLQADLLARSHSDQASKEQVNKYQEELASLESENKILKSKLEDFVSSNEEGAARIQALLGQNAQLREQLKAFQSEQQEKVASLEESLKLLNAANAKLRDEAHADVAALEADLQQAHEENTLLREETGVQIAKLEKDLEQANAANIRSKEQRDDSIAALEEELSGLRNKLQQAQNEKHAALSKTANLQLLSEELIVKETKLAEMRSAAEKYNKALDEQGLKIEEKNSDIATLQENLDTLQKENKDLALALANANSFNEQLQKDWSETLASYQALKKENDEVVLAVNEAENKMMAAHEDQAEKLVSLQKKNQELSAQLESQTREYLVLVRDMETLKQRQQVIKAQPQSVSVHTDEIDALRTNNAILQSELDILREQLARKNSPQVREASLSREEPVTQMDAAARRTREAALEQKQRQSQNEREEITSLASIEPAAGEDNMQDTENSSPDDQVATPSVALAAAPDTAIREVIDGLRVGDENLSEAQKLERSLKSQIQRSSRPPSAAEEYAGQGIRPLEPVIQENIQDPRPQMKQAVTDVAAAPPRGTNTENGVFSPNVDVSDLLMAANIELIEPVSLVSGSSGVDRVAYQWRSMNGLYGSAHQKHLSNLGEFDNYVRDYLTMTEERCVGDFAIIPSSTEQVGQTRIDSYEIACIGDGVNSSASVVFFNSEGTFTVLAHEGATEGMDMAMDARDKIASMVEKS